MASSSSCTDLVIFTLSSPFSNNFLINERFFYLFNQNLFLYQNYKNDGLGGTKIGFGASIYNSSIILSYFIEQNKDLFYKKIGIEIGFYLFLIFSFFFFLFTFSHKVNFSC